MPAVAYPATLPAVQPGWTSVPRERAARSSLPGYPQARRRSSDLIQDASAQWTLPPEKMAIWWEFWHTTLLDGQLWFTVDMPGRGGMIQRIARFRPNTLQVQPLGSGVCRINVDLEIRGRSLAPEVA